MAVESLATVGVVVVSFCSKDVIIECLETLLASDGVKLKIVVVDNASPDGTPQALKAWASGEAPYLQPDGSPLPATVPAAKPLALRVLAEGEPAGSLGQLTLLQSSVNRGFAGGVNAGLRALEGQVDWYWILNPDCAVPNYTAREFVAATADNPGFALMSSRTVYYDHPEQVQTDGGLINRHTGMCRQEGYGAALTTRLPDAANLDWLTGANLFVSPEFLKRAGPMIEDYFLYYEEVDWAFRRGGMPLALAPGALVYHHGGTTIGTGSIARRPSPFANYFNHRNRIRFAKRHLGGWALGAYAYGIAKAGQVLLAGAADEAYAILAGMFDLRPPQSVVQRFPDPRAARLALGRRAP
jgi:GT2 family glycosyltransferase